MAMVNIFMCTYNRAHLLDRCIQSMVSQTFRDWKFIIINDASRDGDNTRYILDKWARQDNRIKVIHEEENSKGFLAKLKNPLMVRSTSKYIGHMDDDDFLYPSSLEERVKCLEEDGKVECCYHDVIRVDEDGRKWYWDCSKGKPFPNVLPTSMLQRGDTFRNLGGWDLDFPVYHGEVDYYIKVDWKLRHIPKALSEALFNKDSMSANRLENVRGLQMLLDKHKDKFTNKEMSEYYAQIGLHSIEGGEEGAKYFLRALGYNKLMIESWGGLLLGWDRKLFLGCYRIYRRLFGYDREL